MNAIRIAGNLMPEHDAALSDYLRGSGRLSREQWHCLREVIDLLVLIRYDDWKARVRSRQTPKGDRTNG